MRGRVALGIFVLLTGVLGGFPAGAVPVDRLEEQYRALMIDGSFDASDAERLTALALSDDLRLSRQESEFLVERIRRHRLEETETLAADGPEGLAVKRARTLMLQALRAGIGAQQYQRAMQQLVLLAMGSDLSRDERFQMLELVDRYRRVDATVSTRDTLEAIALHLSNPDEARLDREHRRKLELLEKQFQVPVILDAASRSIR
jgi:hypothetical protein